MHRHNFLNRETGGSLHSCYGQVSGLDTLALTFGAVPEKLDAVIDNFKAILRLQERLNRVHQIVLRLDDDSTGQANHVVMRMVLFLMVDFIADRVVAEIVPRKESDVGQQLQGSVDRGNADFRRFLPGPVINLLNSQMLPFADLDSLQNRLPLGRHSEPFFCQYFP